MKAGTGVLQISSSNTNHNGGFTVAEGTLAWANAPTNPFGTGLISVGTTTDTRSKGAQITLDLSPTASTNLSNSMAFGTVNYEGLSVLQIGNSMTSSTLSGAIAIDRTAGRNVLVQTGASTNANLSGVISGNGGFTLNGGGILRLTNGGNTYGALAGGSGAGFDSATIVRGGTLRVEAAGALSGASIELGDAAFPVSNVLRATTGASVLGTDRDTVGFTASNRNALGGSFVSNANGLYAGGGAADIDPGTSFGAFYSVNATIDGYTFTQTDVTAGSRVLVKDEIDNPERNGIYKVVFINQDGTMNLARVSDFGSTGTMLYGTQVTVGGGTQTGTYYMAAPTVTNRNGADTDPVHWVRDTVNPNVTLQINNAAVTSITQAIDVNANGTGLTTISSANPVNFSGPVTLQDMRAGVQDTKQLRIDSTGTDPVGIHFSGILSEATPGIGATDDVLSLLKIGTGTATLSGANAYEGATTVSAGTLLVNNVSGSGTGSGAISVASGATLGGSGIISPANNNDISISSGANLSVGTPGSSLAQSLTINLSTGSDLIMAGNLRLDLLFNQAGSTLTEADRLIFTKTGTPNINLAGSSLVVSAINGLTPSSFNVGDTWKIIDWASIVPTGTFTGLTGSFVNDANYLPDLSGIGRMWDISGLYTNGTIIVAVPEPSKLVLLMLGLLGLGMRRRRRSE